MPANITKLTWTDLAGMLGGMAATRAEKRVRTNQEISVAKLQEEAETITRKILAENRFRLSPMLEKADLETLPAHYLKSYAQVHDFWRRQLPLFGPEGQVA